MSHVPAELLYTKEHEWIRVEGNFVFVGITDFAQHELGDIVFVELPETGDTVSAHQTFGTVESVKTVSDLYAPLTGTIAAINSDLIDHPEKVNEDPYGEGWMLKVELENPDELKTLLSSEAYTSQIKG